MKLNQINRQLLTMRQRTVLKASIGFVLISVVIGSLLLSRPKNRPTADVEPTVIPPVQNLKAYVVCLEDNQNVFVPKIPKVLAAAETCLGQLGLWVSGDSPVGHEDSDLAYEINLRYSPTTNEDDPFFDDRFWHLATVGSGGQEFEDEEGYIKSGSWLSTDKLIYLHQDLSKDEILDEDGAILTVEVIAFDEHTQEASEPATYEVKFPLGGQPAPL